MNGDSDKRGKRYCKNCDAFTLTLRPGKGGKWFYGCQNYPSCTYTEKSGRDEPEDPPVDEKSETEKLIDAEELAKAMRASVKRGTEELEANALRLGVRGPAEELAAMREAIPNFGKPIDELTDEDRKARTDWFSSRVQTGGFRALPYDKERKQG